jgi:predicted O-methyltransferase YrrM
MRLSSVSSTQLYIEETFIDETIALKQARERGEIVNSGMQVSPVEGKLLMMLAQMVQAKHILEIGTFVGYSALWMAQALPLGGTITTLEGSPHQAHLARAHFDASPYPERFIIREGMALNSLREMQQEGGHQFDMIFIDASKSDYAEYLTLTEPMLRKGGLLIGDNTLLFGHMAGEPRKPAHKAAIAAVQTFNDVLGKSGRFTSVLLPTEEGLTIAIKL